jgi:hypothetical protein
VGLGNIAFKENPNLMGTKLGHEYKEVIRVVEDSRG